jgi:hypothetical protein
MMAAEGAARRRAAWVLTLLGPMAAAQFSLAYIYGTTNYVDLHEYALGHARLPFQYRALTGWLLWAGLHVPGLSALVPAPYEQMDAARLMEMVLVFGSVLWILRSARQVAGTIFADPLVTRAMGLTFLATLYINYAEPAYARHYSYPYDLPSLALIFAGFIAVLRQQIWRLLVLFALATLARETAIILVPIFLCWNWPVIAPAERPALLPLGRAMALAGVMIVIWAAEKAGLQALYGANLSEAVLKHRPALAGGMVLQIGGNMLDMVQPFRWPVAFSELCWLWLPVFCFWRLIDHVQLKRAIRILTPYWVIGMSMVGVLRETRVFGELTILYWMAALVLGRWFWQLQPLTQHDQDPSVA